MTPWPREARVDASGTAKGPRLKCTRLLLHIKTFRVSDQVLNMQMRARPETSPRRAYTVMTTPNGSVHRQHGGLDAAPQPQSSTAAPNAAEAGAFGVNRGLLKGASASNGSPDETLQVGYTFTSLRPFRCITQQLYPYSWHIGNPGRYRKIHERLLTQSRHSPLLVRPPRATKELPSGNFCE
jgi:hypothetical protein